jgi:hypothetical protein
MFWAVLALKLMLCIMVLSVYPNEILFTESINFTIKLQCKSIEYAAMVNVFNKRITQNKFLNVINCNESQILNNKFFKIVVNNLKFFVNFCDIAIYAKSYEKVNIFASFLKN